MIPCPLGAWIKPDSGASSWGYAGCILCLSAVNQSTPTGYFLNKDGDAGQSSNIYFNNAPTDMVYAFGNNNNPVTYDRTDPSYDRTVPFTFDGTTEIISAGYEGDITADEVRHVWQLLDSADANIFKFTTTGRPSGYGIDCTYQIGSDTPVGVSNTGSYPALKLVFTFSGTTVTATDEYGGSDHVNGFTATSVDLASATQLKVSGGYCKISHSGILGFQVYTYVGYWPAGRA